MTSLKCRHTLLALDRLTKRYLVLAIVVLSSTSLFAQFDPQIGHYMYLPTAFNPAAAREGDMLKISGMHRMQFTGIQNAPMSTYFCAASPFVIGKTKHGAGVRFLNDRFGLYTNMTFHVQYAYRHKIGKGYLSAGVDLGFVSVGFKGDSVNLSKLNDSYHEADDQWIPKSSEAGMSFDMGLGLYYTAPRWYAGISYSHLNFPTVHWGDYATVRLRGTMYAFGGYNHRFKNKDWQLKPSLMVMTDFTGWDVNIAALCEYKDRYTWGLAYRIASNVAIMLGIDIIDGLHLGYTYELPTSKLLIESFGSHEVYLAYALNILKPKHTNRYKSIRFL